MKQVFFVKKVNWANSLLSFGDILMANLKIGELGHTQELAKKTQSQIDTIPSGHNFEWTQPRMDPIPNGRNPE